MSVGTLGADLDENILENILMVLHCLTSTNDRHANRQGTPVDVAELCVGVLQQCCIPKQVGGWWGERLRSHKALVKLHQEVQTGVQPCPETPKAHGTAQHQGTAQQHKVQHSVITLWHHGGGGVTP